MTPDHPDDQSPRDDVAHPVDLVSFLPERVWYLSQSGADMWCRRPYGFFFSSAEAALAFAQAMAVEYELSPVGVDASELVSDDGLAAMRALAVTRIFIDPRMDEATGDVFGSILRLSEAN